MASQDTQQQSYAAPFRCARRCPEVPSDLHGRSASRGLMAASVGAHRSNPAQVRLRYRRLFPNAAHNAPEEATVRSVQ